MFVAGLEPFVPNFVSMRPQSWMSRFLIAPLDDGQGTAGLASQGVFVAIEAMRVSSRACTKIILFFGIACDKFGDSEMSGYRQIFEG